MIPKANERHLMLHDEVVQAVTDGQFHIWSIETVEQGIEILTGVKAGQRSKDGRFPKGSVYQLVDERLRSMGERLQEQKRKSKSGKKSSS